MSLEKIATKEVVKISPESTLRDAAKLMREHHVGDVVVVKPGRTFGKSTPIGIITDRDIVMSTVALGVDPSDVTVEEVMFTNLATANLNDSFYHVLALMKENGIKRIPLIDFDGTLVGIVTADDIIEVLASEMSDVAKITDRQRGREQQRRRKLA